MKTLFAAAVIALLAETPLADPDAEARALQATVRATRQLLLEGLERLRRECVAEDASFSMTVKPLRLDRGFATDPSADLVTFISGQTGKASDTVSFGTEGPQLVALGAVPVVFGPGDITVAHQTGEHVPTKELLKCAEVMEAALLHFAG
jgi:acetylornithine deacetylase